MCHQMTNFSGIIILDLPISLSFGISLLFFLLSKFLLAASKCFFAILPSFPRLRVQQKKKDPCLFRFFLFGKKKKKTRFGASGMVMHMVWPSLSQSPTKWPNPCSIPVALHCRATLCRTTFSRIWRGVAGESRYTPWKGPCSTYLLSP